MIWIEARISQGRRFSPEEANEVSSTIEGVFRREDAAIVPPSRIFCEAEETLAWCYIAIEELPRVSVGRLVFFRERLRQAFNEQPNRSLDEVNVIEEEEIARFVPEAVR